MSAIKNRFQLVTPVINDQNRMCVYRITFECGMFYIGSSLNLARRATQYRYNFYNRNDINKKLKAALNSHNSAIMDIIEICHNEKMLRDREDFHIKENFENPHILNRSNSSYSNRSKKTVEERYVSGNYMRGRKLTDEQRRHWSEVKKGTVISPDHRKRISIAKTGMKFSDEHKKNLSAAKIGKAKSEKWHAAMKGKGSKKVDRFDLIGNFIETHPSYSHAAECIGSKAGHIGECVNGKYTKLKGFVFKKHEENNTQHNPDDLGESDCQ